MEDADSVKARLEGAAHYYVAKFCDAQVENSKGEIPPISRQGVASLNDVFCKFIENYAKDVEMFAKHRKKKTVNTEDIILFTRKNEGLQKEMKEKAAAIESHTAKERATKAAKRPRADKEKEKEKEKDDDNESEKEKEKEKKKDDIQDDFNDFDMNGFDRELSEDLLEPPKKKPKSD